MAIHEPRRIGPGDLPSQILLTVDEAFDIAEALETAEHRARQDDDAEAGLRAATALSIVLRALGVA